MRSLLLLTPLLLVSVGASQPSHPSSSNLHSNEQTVYSTTERVNTESYTELLKLKPLRDGKVLANWDFVIRVPEWEGDLWECEFDSYPPLEV